MKFSVGNCTKLRRNTSPKFTSKIVMLKGDCNHSLIRCGLTKPALINRLNLLLCVSKKDIQGKVSTATCHSYSFFVCLHLEQCVFLICYLPEKKIQEKKIQSKATNQSNYLKLFSCKEQVNVVGRFKREKEQLRGNIIEVSKIP